MNRISPDIRVGELHIWIADLDAREPTGGGAHGRDPLSIDERERAERFLNRGDGERWAHSRVLLRLLLGSYLSTEPAELRFQLGEHGKPRLASDAGLRFNLSHSAGYGLYVFALGCEVGVDVETPGRDVDVLAVAGRALGQEVAELLRPLEGSRREHEFLRAWVRHEARLKCLGVGLGGSTKAHEDECWTVDVELDEPATAAVAAKHAPAKVECLRWKPRDMV